MANHADQALENAFGGLIQGIAQMIVSMFTNLFWGIKKLQNKKNRYGLYIAVFLWEMGLLFDIRKLLELVEAPTFIHTLLWWLFLSIPFIYLIVTGRTLGLKQKEYFEIFEECGFKSKDGKYPMFLSERKVGKKTITYFKSTIPLPEWVSREIQLETAMNCNILQFKPTQKNKRVIEVTSVPTECVTPEYLEWADGYIHEEDGVITVGQSMLREITFNLNRVPHVLIAGETGSGKSVILRSCLWQCIKKGCRAIMIDFKGGIEFGKQYEQFGEVVTERARALEILTELTEENEYRMNLFRDMEVKNLAEYNKKTGKNLCRICVFSDELAEMLDKKGMNKADKEITEKIEGKLSTLARLSRATGINLFLGVQRPDANVLTGQIKNNIPVRICGRFADKSASEIVLGNTDACHLPDIKGRFLYRVGNDTEEFQSYYFDDAVNLHPIKVTVGEMLTRDPDHDPEDHKRMIEKEDKGVIEFTPKSVKNKKVASKQKVEEEVMTQQEVPYEDEFDFEIKWGGDDK